MRWPGDEEPIMSVFRQIGAVTATNIRSLPSRVGSSSVIVLGIAGVVGVLVSVLAMSQGLRQTMLSTAQPDRAIVLSEGANNEGGSALAVDAVLTIGEAPGIARTAAGDVAASPEMVASVNLNRRGDGNRSTVMVRGLTAQGIAIRPEFELVDGRMARPGLRELIVGRSVQLEFQGLAMGDQVVLRDGPWTIVGVFRSGGTANESTLIADADTLRSAYQRNSYSSVRVQLESPAAYETFRDALTTNPSLSVNVMTEPQFYEQAANSFRTLFDVITYVVGGIMSAGALLAALNTMYSAVSTRSVEIATLRAIGFGSGGVVASVLVEAMLLAVVGAVLGAAVATAMFSGNVISLGGGAGSIVAEMRVTTDLIVAGVALACVVGLIGGLAPALRAARLPVATALRAA
jgi:putative ABC transport system permease protein